VHACLLAVAPATCDYLVQEGAHIAMQEV